MKIIWDESDIRAGRRVADPKFPKTWMIVKYAGGDDTWTCVNLTDGFAWSFASKETLIKSLNACGLVPGESA